MTVLQINVQPHRGYSADQALEESEMTIGDLIARLQEAADEHGDDARIVTFDPTNRYGAQWGSFDRWGDLVELTDCEENADQLPCEDCEAISREFCTCND